MERFLLQKKINDRWCNFTSFDKIQNAIICIKILNHKNCRVFDRKTKKYFY